jgi:hypothetical protein
MVFVLGFSGCDTMKDLLGLDEENPALEPELPVIPENPVRLRLYVKSDGNNESSGTTSVPLLTIQTALKRVQEMYANTDDPWQGKGDAAKEKSAEIVLLDRIEIGAISINGPFPPLILSAQNPVKPEKGEGHITLLNGAGNSNSLLTVGNGATLTLRDITLEGSNSSSHYSLVQVYGNLILANNAVIYGHNTRDAGGGVYVEDGYTFTMSGGEIQGNKARYGGGVYVKVNGHFAKTGKSVIYGVDDHEINADNKTDNTAVKDGNAVYVNSTPAEKRDSAAGKNDNLSYDGSGTATGDWDSQ